MKKRIMVLALILAMMLSLVACKDRNKPDDDLESGDSQIQQEDVQQGDKDSATEDDKQPSADDDTAVDGADTDGTIAESDKKPNETPDAAPEKDQVNTDKPDAGDEPEENEEEVHEHNYTKKVVSATCTTGGYTQHTCSCGDSYKDASTTKLGHNYSGKVVAPTSTAKGYTLYTCSRCGATYKDNYTPATGTGNSGNGGGGSTTPSTPSTPSTPVHQHSYSEIVTPATCTTKGYTTYTCACGHSYTANYNGGNGHSYKEVYENVPVYETVCITRCGYCHADITGNVDAHVKEETLAGNGGRSYQSYEQVLVGYQNEVVGYKCSVCGADR